MDKHTKNEHVCRNIQEMNMYVEIHKNITKSTIVNGVMKNE